MGIKIRINGKWMEIAGVTKPPQWGDIQGSLAAQADLMAVLDAKVPVARKVAGKPLSADVTLGPEDVDAIPVRGGTLSGYLPDKLTSQVRNIRMVPDKPADSEGMDGDIFVTPGPAQPFVVQDPFGITIDGVKLQEATADKYGVMTSNQVSVLDTLQRDLNTVRTEYLDKYNPQEVQDITGTVNFMRSPTIPTPRSADYNANISMHALNVESMAFLASRTMVFRQGTNNTSLIRNAYVIGTMACDGLKGMPTVEIGSAMYIAIGAFQSSDVEVVIAPKHDIIVESYAFVNAKKLRRVDYYPASVEGATFNNTVIDTLIIRTPKVVPLRYPDTFANTPIGDGTGYVYVPDELVDQYKQATNWTAVASQIKPISELPPESSEASA